MSNKKLVLLVTLATLLFGCLAWLTASRPSLSSEVSRVSEFETRSPAAAVIETGLEASARAIASETRRRDAASIASESTHPAAPAAAVLVVHTIASISRAPIAGISHQHRSRFPEEPARGETVDGAHGSVDEWPLTDARGYAEIDVPAGRPLTLSARSEEALAASRIERILALAPASGANSSRNGGGRGRALPWVRAGAARLDLPSLVRACA